MREWAAPEKADIIVSELLGSFGDNELSPECLDGAQHFLKGNSLLWFDFCSGSFFFLRKIKNVDAIAALSLNAEHHHLPIKQCGKHFLSSITFHASSHLKSLSLSPFPHLIVSPSDDGVSIPCSYTSFLAPLSSSKLYNEVRSCRERDKDPECHFETPYVVRLHNFHQLADPKPCFTFTHPTTGRQKH